MNKLTPIFIAAALAVSAGLAIAQRQMNTADPMPGHTMPGMEVSASTTPSTKAYIAANDSMHKDMMLKFTGDADIDFMRAMIPHDQGAIDMAKVMLEHGRDPVVRKLADAVIKARDGEIAMMRTWLADRGKE